MNRIAIVDHDPVKLRALRALFEELGCKVDLYRDATTGFDGIHRRRPELVIITAGGRIDGLALLERLRRLGGLAVILLAPEGDGALELAALRLGAHDVVSRDAAPSLLLERVRRLDRLLNPDEADEKALPTKVIDLPPLKMDSNRHLVSWNGKEVELTRSEFRVLHYLADRPGYLRDRAAIQEHVYDEGVHVADRTIDCHIKRLRRKLRRIDPEFEAIGTVYGMGYRYEPPKPAQGTASAAQSRPCELRDNIGGLSC